MSVSNNDIEGLDKERQQQSTSCQYILDTILLRNLYKANIPGLLTYKDMFLLNKVTVCPATVSQVRYH